MLTRGNSETPPCSPWLCEWENADGEKAPTELRPSEAGLDGLRHWRMFLSMHFFETPVFRRQITALLDDGDYRQLQVTLALKPEAGDLIRGSGGLRKVRWAVRGRGKNG